MRTSSSCSRLAARLEERLELDRDVEVILDGVLAAAGDEDDVVDAGRDRLLDAVLDDRLVDERQHFLRLRLGGGQEAGAEAGGGKDGLSNQRHALLLDLGSGYSPSLSSGGDSPRDEVELPTTVV